MQRETSRSNSVEKTFWRGYGHVRKCDDDDDDDNYDDDDDINRPSTYPTCT